MNFGGCCVRFPQVKQENGRHPPLDSLVSLNPAYSTGRSIGYGEGDITIIIVPSPRCIRPARSPAAPRAVFFVGPFMCCCALLALVSPLRHPATTHGHFPTAGPPSPQPEMPLSRHEKATNTGPYRGQYIPQHLSAPCQPSHPCCNKYTVVLHLNDERCFLARTQDPVSRFCQELKRAVAEAQ